MVGTEEEEYIGLCVAAMCVEQEGRLASSAGVLQRI